MKSDLAALDHKISAELKPSDAEEAARTKVVTPTKGNGEPLDPPEQTQSPEVKKTMVAEPVPRYDHEQQPGRSTRFVASALGIAPNVGNRSSGIKF